MSEYSGNTIGIVFDRNCWNGVKLLLHSWPRGSRFRGPLWSNIFETRLNTTSLFGKVSDSVWPEFFNLFMFSYTVGHGESVFDTRVDPKWSNIAPLNLTDTYAPASSNIFLRVVLNRCVCSLARPYARQLAAGPRFKALLGSWPQGLLLHCGESKIQAGLGILAAGAVLLNCGGSKIQTGLRIRAAAALPPWRRVQDSNRSWDPGRKCCVWWLPPPIPTSRGARL